MMVVIGEEIDHSLYVSEIDRAVEGIRVMPLAFLFSNYFLDRHRLNFIEN